MADELYISDANTTLHLKYSDVAGTQNAQVPLYASDGSALIFGDDGLWVDGTGDQMVDNVADSLFFGGAFWASGSVGFYNKGAKYVKPADLTLYIKRS